MAPQGQTVGYVRVSSAVQNLARQLEAIGKVDKLFQEAESGGSRADRQALAECISYVRDGDIVKVASIDRLARSLRDLKDIVEELLAKGARVQFMKEGQTYSPDGHDAIAQLLLNMLGAFAEFERALIRERQAEGIRIAKAAGKYGGRKRRLTAEQVATVRELAEQGVPKSRIAQQFGVDRSTIYRSISPR